MSNESDSDLDERIEILKQKYLQRRKRAPDVWAGDGHRSELCDAAGHTLRDIHRTPRADMAEDEPSDEDDPPEETNVFCTETDVTLPSDLDLARSSSSSALNSRGTGIVDQSSGAAAVHVYQEMLHIYEKLQAERLSQQVWAAQLCERERDLQQRETVFQQQQRSAHRLRVEQELLRRVQNLQQQYQQEKSDLETALKQKTKENKRMKASFDSMKELNDSMKKQLNEVSEQNRKLECQSRKVQARLENLQRKYECFTTHRSRETAVPKAHDPKPSKPEKPASNKAAGKAAAHGPSPRLLALLLDWLVDGQLMEVRDGPRPSPQERCARHAVLTSTLRRLGEEVSRGSRVAPLFKSSCLHTRFLCSLIIIKTISQVDVLAQAVEVLSGAVRTDEGQALFLEYQALPAVLALLRSGSPGLLAPSVDVLLQMSTESRTLSAFLDQCSSEDFFRCASLFLRNPRLEPPLLEKMLMLLQKLSGIRKNKRLFEASSLHLLLQEMHRTSDRSQAFISMNLSSILLNLGMLTRS
uniref:Coiled-coil domain-containing protein 138 n=1 Tax=Cyprinus carpio TaxID=7962 RepID=A0A8C2JD61_CYPCA